MSFLWLMTGVAVIAFVIVVLAYGVQWAKRDAGIGDAAWSGGLAISAIWLAVMAEGNPVQRWAVVLLTFPWGLRLAWFILKNRVVGQEEDPRYAALRERWGARANLYFFAVFLLQGGLIILFSLPLLAAVTQPDEGWSVSIVLALITGWGAILGEVLADRQLTQWRSKPENAGKLMRSGLWRYSRHPNYFFEWVHWWAYVILAWGSWNILLALTGPVFMYVFLVHITGIPPSESRSLMRRGSEFEAYQRSTSKFFPWFPRE